MHIFLTELTLVLEEFFFCQGIHTNTKAGKTYLLYHSNAPKWVFVSTIWQNRDRKKWKQMLQLCMLTYILTTWAKVSNIWHFYHLFINFANTCTSIYLCKLSTGAKLFTMISLWQSTKILIKNSYFYINKVWFNGDKILLNSQKLNCLKLDKYWTWTQEKILALVTD